MNVFQTEILQQGEALRANAALHGDGRTRVALSGLAVPKRVLLTGMGASFHAAIWGSHLLQRHGIWAVAAESSELLYYSGRLLQDVDCIVVVSQSGSSAEIAPLLDMAPYGVTVIGITNRPDSPLGARADRVLSLEAGEERVVATKTYLNTLACLWFLASHWSSRSPSEATAQIVRLAAEVEGALSRYDELADEWSDAFGTCDDMLFIGHGPHLATARQSAMMIGEWLKQLAVGTSAGAFRHGLIEIAAPGVAVVLYGASGSAGASIERLSNELLSCGATVLCIAEGALRKGFVKSKCRFDEMWSPLLDVVPAQIFVEAKARQLKVAPVFRNMGKVVLEL